MKKFLAILLALTLVLALAACGGEGDDKTDGTDGEADGTGVDLSAYPASLDDWTVSQLLEYFKKAVPALNDSSLEDWYQDHENYWSGFPIDDVAGTWNDEGSISIEFFAFSSPDAVDTTQEEIDNWKQILRDDATHSYITDDIFLGPITHMVGNKMFDYEYIESDEIYNAVDAAYNALISALGATPDF